MAWRHLRKRLLGPLFRRRRLAERVRRPATIAERPARIDVVLVTWNRLAFARLAVRALLDTARLPGSRIVIWDNGSTDGTAEFLGGLDDPRLRVTRHPENLGLSAYARAARGLDGDYLAHMDDDVLLLPGDWQEAMVMAFRKAPRLGYLGLDVHQDEFTNGARPTPTRYCLTRYDDETTIAYGPVGGWFAMTPREVYERVGGFLDDPTRKYFLVDGNYYQKVRHAGRDKGLLWGRRAYHACGLWRPGEGPRPDFLACFEQRHLAADHVR